MKPIVKRIWIGKKFIEANTMYSLGDGRCIFIDKYGEAMEVINNESREMNIRDAFHAIADYYENKGYVY